MSTETGAPAGSDAAPAIEDTSELTIEQARAMLDAPEESPSDINDAAREAMRAPDEPESSKDDSAPEKDPAEDAPEADPEAEAPEPIEPPRSWTKEEKEAFKTWPREAQETSARIASTREAEFRRSQNEIAEQRKAIETEREQAKQARQQYESKLSNTVKAMESSLQAEFGDIQTMQDVRNLQANDPFRFQAWQVRQMELTAAKSEEIAAEQRQAQEKQSKRQTYEAQENARLIELVPEMADPKKASELRERAVAMLTDDLGLKTDVLGRWMSDDTGHEILSNAGIQKLIADGLKYRDIQNAPKAVAAKPLPPVQRPGVARPAGSGDSEKIQALEARLTQTGSLKDAEALLNAQLAAQSRRRAS